MAATTPFDVDQLYAAIEKAPKPTNPPLNANHPSVYIYDDGAHIARSIGGMHEHQNMQDFRFPLRVFFETSNNIPMTAQTKSEVCSKISRIPFFQTIRLIDPFKRYPS